MKKEISWMEQSRREREVLPNAPTIVPSAALRRSTDVWNRKID